MKNIVIFGVRDNALHTFSVEVPAGMTGKELKNWKAKNTTKIADLDSNTATPDAPIIVEVVDSDLTEEPG